MFKVNNRNNRIGCEISKLAIKTPELAIGFFFLGEGEGGGGEHVLGFLGRNHRN